MSCAGCSPDDGVSSPQLSKAEQHAVEEHRQRLSQQWGREVSLEEALQDWLAHYAVAWREAWLRTSMACQRDEIMKHKWIESEKAHRDLGKDAVFDWISKYAEKWRRWYEDQGDPKG